MPTTRARRVMTAVTAVAVATLLVFLVGPSSPHGAIGRLGASDRRPVGPAVEPQPEPIRVGLEMAKSEFTLGEALTIREVVLYQTSQPACYPEHDFFNENLWHGSIRLDFGDTDVKLRSSASPKVGLVIDRLVSVGYESGPGKRSYSYADLRDCFSPLPIGQYRVPYSYAYDYSVLTLAGDEIKRKGVARGVLRFAIVPKGA